jgi:heme ABC exporter ATP-binding subunit CcmA
MVSVDAVRKSFGPTVVLEEVTFDLRERECLVLFGANGAGKSTLLKILATLLRPSAGTVRIAGLDAVKQAEAVRTLVGFLGHSSYLYEDLTALENLKFWVTLGGLDASASALLDALARVELEGVAGERVRTFSRGMKRRLALARVLLSAPRLLLLDEPLDGLDQRGKKWLEGVLVGFRERGGAVLLTTHSLSRGLSIADRVAILSGGRIVVDRPGPDLSLEELRRLYALYTDEAV